MFRIFGLVLALSVWAVAPARAQDQTLADIRQELSVLFVDMQRLKRELSTTGGAGGAVGGGSALQRLDQIEAEMVRLTSKTEQLENRINRIVKDGTNRIGDLEFRLVELEGGDLGALGETSTLGGGSGGEQVAVIQPADTGSAELAMGEQGDFDRAKAALDTGDYSEAVEKFTVFSNTYMGGPLTGDAHYYRGQALFALGDTANAARAFLESFSGSPSSPRAPDALYELGKSLGALGQLNEACISLAEVEVRFPGSSAVGDARAALQQLGCS
ncbi:MAG: tol-pal system protein YbgF [Paracoccaceae bacterium]